MTQLLTMTKTHKFSLQGDSGGPLSVVEGGKHVVVGVVSYGYGCANKHPGAGTFEF